MGTLEERVRQLEDVEAIRRLRVRYGQLCDANYDADGIAELFSEDAVFDGDNLGIYHGREAIRQFFAGLSRRITFAVHHYLGHQIDIDPSGEEATGTWYGFSAVTLEGRPVWIGGTHRDRYRKVDGRWLFSSTQANRRFFTPYELGWVKQRLLG